MLNEMRLFLYVVYWHMRLRIAERKYKVIHKAALWMAGNDLLAENGLNAVMNKCQSICNDFIGGYGEVDSGAKVE